MLTLVPEGTQIPAGYPGYGGQFGSYLPLLWGVRDILSFVDVQDYNTPPLQGLDGEIYQLGSVNYDAAMTELVLHGFSGEWPRRRFLSARACGQGGGGISGGNRNTEAGERRDAVLDHRESSPRRNVQVAAAGRISRDDWRNVLDD